MVTPYRTDNGQTVGPSWGRQPIVLAQLPNVGKATVLVHPKQPASSTPPQHVPQTQHAPHSLPTQEAQTLRIDLPQVEASSPSQTEQRTQSISKPPHTKRTKSPSSSNSPLLKLHALLAPFAGLIVASALIASAGFLYWLMIGPAPLPINYQDMEYPEIDGGGFGQSALTSPNEDTTPLAGDASESVPVSQTLSSQTQPAEAVVPQPQIETAPELVFPKTDRSSALDFSKVGDVFDKQHAPESLPKIAELPDTASTSPTVNR